MEPIISPWIIYWIHVFDKINIACALVTIIGSIVFGITWLVGITEDDKDLINFAKKASIVIAICATILMVVPDKQTMMAMIAANYITPENVQLVQENIVDFIKKIVEATK